MDYFILTLKTKIQTTTGEIDHIGFVCVNSVVRCKNALGQDVTRFVSSGIGQEVLTENVIAITAATPSTDAISALK